jgi:steroid delta-isomerase-like uncharacterized protein
MAQAQTLLHRWFDEVWNQRNESAIDALMADDALVHGIAGADGSALRGPAAFRPFFRQFSQAFPDLRITVEDALVDGDKIAVRCSVTATHTGASMLAAPTNRPAHFTGMCIARVRDGKIVEGWNNFDFLSMYRQLGITPR